jgi:outer membrane protein OmpA-like peptidoglycan-associated protein
MKNSEFFALGVIFLTVVSFQPLGAGTKRAQTNNTPSNSNYVVIGAFAIEKNAVKFAAEAVKKSHHAKFEINANRNLYYVFVMTTDDHAVAISEALRLRKESSYYDTWVYNGLLGEAGLNVKGTDINPESQQKIEHVASTETAAEKGPVTESPVISEGTPQVAEVKPEGQPVTESEEKPTVEIEPDIEIEGKGFFFKIFRGDDGAQVEGDVNVIDAERSRKIGTFSGNKRIGISDPKSKADDLALVCEVFGFRKIQRDINYNTPQGEGIEVDEKGTTVVPFELVRLQQGDIAVMYNVFFYKDAAIMRPESRFEVTSLLEMLKENPKYKIRLHGHTNGGAHGRIISLNDGNENYFALADTKDGIGSAKELSEQRAGVVKNFLVSNGIDPSRMEVKAWGGKRPLYDKHSPQAQSNVRVEVEILEN